MTLISSSTQKSVSLSSTMAFQLAWKVASVLLGAALIAGLLVSYLGPPIETLPRAPTDTPVHLKIAQEDLFIPLNLIRFGNQRAGGSVDRVDMAIHWPSMTGYSEAMDEAFNDVSEVSPILFVSIEPTTSEMDSTTRLATIYLPSFTDEVLLAPDGLVGRHLNPEDGFFKEVVYFEAGSTRPFVARCANGTDAEIPPDCLRQINLSGGLTLSYRFRFVHLEAWRELDAAVFTLAAQFRQQRS